MFSRLGSLTHPSLNVSHNPFFHLTEMKSSRQAIGRNFALPDNYDTFLSFPSGKGKGGYSGVSVYSKVTPRKAEEGLTGLLQPRPPWILANEYPAFTLTRTT